MTKPARNDKGQLQAGHKMGRPAGSSERDQIRALAQPHRTTAIQALVDTINAKDNPQAVVKAATEILDRLAARPKAQDERVSIPALKTASTLEEKCLAVLEAIADKQVSATAGRQVLAALADVARILEISDLAERVKRLEGRKRARVVDAEPDDGGDLV